MLHWGEGERRRQVHPHGPAPTTTMRVTTCVVCRCQTRLSRPSISSTCFKIVGGAWQLEIKTPMVRGNIGLKHSATARPNDFVSLIVPMSRPSKASTCQRNYGLECDSWSLEKSKCLGCAGNVDVHVAGVGAYNATLSSTCLRTAAQQTCSCNASGIPHRVYKNRLPSVWQEFIFDDNQVAQESYGNWTSTGNCTFDNITGAVSPCGGSHVCVCVCSVYTLI